MKFVCVGAAAANKKDRDQQPEGQQFYHADLGRSLWIPTRPTREEFVRLMQPWSDRIVLEHADSSVIVRFYEQILFIQIVAND